MKTSISRDGVLRADFSVSFRLSVEDMAALFVSYNGPTVTSLETMVKMIEKKTKKAILDDVKAALHNDGRLHAIYRVSDNYQAAWLWKVTQLFTKRFPEFVPTEAQAKAIEKFKLKKAK